MTGKELAMRLMLHKDTVYSHMANPDEMSMRELRRMVELGIIADKEELWRVVDWKEQMTK